MTGKTYWPLFLLAVIAVSILTTGCDIQITQGFLEEAGFVKKNADTPAKLEHLKSLTQHTLVLHERNEESYYVYADASNCKCMYVGDEQAFQKYRQIIERISSLEEPVPGPRSIDPGMNWEMWSPWDADRSE